MLRPLLVMCIVVLGLGVSTSGCFGDCNSYSRGASWIQEDIPVPQPSSKVEHQMGEYYGYAVVEVEPRKIIALVIDDEPVPQDVFIAFTYSLFENQSWPEPRMEGATELGGCEDVL